MAITNPILEDMNTTSHQLISKNAQIFKKFEKINDDNLLYITGLITKHKMQFPLNERSNLTTTEQHYKLWRFFISNIIFENYWFSATKFAMYFIDIIFYQDNPFFRDIILSGLHDFIKIGYKNNFDFEEIRKTIKTYCELFSCNVVETLLFFEQLKFCFINNKTFSPNTVNNYAIYTFCAKMKVNPIYINEIACDLKMKKYAKISQKIFNQKSKFANLNIESKLTSPKKIDNQTIFI